MVHSRYVHVRHLVAVFRTHTMPRTQARIQVSRTDSWQSHREKELMHCTFWSTCWWFTRLCGINVNDFRTSCKRYTSRYKPKVTELFVFLALPHNEEVVQTLSANVIWPNIKRWSSPPPDHLSNLCILTTVLNHTSAHYHTIHFLFFCIFLLTWLFLQMYNLHVNLVGCWENAILHCDDLPQLMFSNQDLTHSNYGGVTLVYISDVIH